MMRLLLLALAAAGGLSGCTGRFSDPLTCLPDGSVTVWEYPNSQGSYDGLKSSSANCAAAQKRV
jgi:ABC-type glycerol-3-phosphate transport system substrate-binding protein